jgi:hypothetical protein
MPYQPITKDKVCNWTFVKESDLPNGEKLNGCARCSECWYKDRESQLEHWPFHKKSCRSIAEETATAIHREISSIEECVQMIVSFLNRIERLNVYGGRPLLHAFRELRRLLIEEEVDLQNNSDDNVIDPIIQAYMKCVQLKGRDILLDMWAIPGWASFFLSEDLFLSHEMKRRKDLGLPAVKQPKEEIVHKNRSLPLVCAKLVFTMYSLTAAEAKNGKEILHSDPLAAAVVRNTNRAWISEYVRESLPKNDDFIDQTFKSNFEQPFFSNLMKKHCRPDELVPGLTAKQLLTILITNDAPLQGIGNEKRSQLLGVVYLFGAYFEDNKHLPWSHLTAKDRIELLDMSHNWDAPKKKCVYPQAEFFTNIRTCVLHMITGCQTKTLLEMYSLCQTMLPPPDERTVQMIKKIRNAMLVQFLPKVAIYAEVIEPKARAKGTDQTFPEVLNPLIAEFSFGQKYIWASNDQSRKGLRFLTEAAIEEQHRSSRSLTRPLRKKHPKTNIYDDTPSVPVYDDDEDDDGDITRTLTWAQVEEAKGSPVNGFLVLAVVEDESSTTRQVFQCRDSDGETRRVVVHTNSGRVPGLTLWSQFAWQFPRLHYFEDGSSGGRIEEIDLKLMTISS